MPILEARATYPGINQIEVCQIAMSNGITPGNILLTIIPQEPETIALTGALVLTYGNTSISYVNCLADQATYEYDGNGFVMSLVLRDFRWEWQFGWINGRFNVKNANDELRVIDNAPPSDTDVIGNTERTPQELAALLLSEMVDGGNFDESGMPNDQRPSVVWNFANPATELNNLCRALNCEIVPSPDGFVSIEQRGVGDPLPPGQIESTSALVDPPPPPKRLVVVCAPTLYEVDLGLVAVGIETDGTIKEIDDLSYAPPTGWDNYAADGSTIPNKKWRELARRCIFRWYAVRRPQSVWANDPPTDYVQEVIIRPHLLDVNPLTGDNYVPFVWGIFRDTSSWAQSDNYADLLDITRDQVTTAHQDAIVPAGFSIDYTRRIVQFSQTVHKGGHAQGASDVAPAELFLRCCIQLRLLDTGVVDRDYVTWTIDPAQKRDRVIIREDIRRWERKGTGGAANNEPEVDAEAQKVIDAILPEYSLDTPVTNKYTGIVNIPLSGTIRSVNWQYGPGGATTDASYNTDPGGPIMPAEPIKRASETLTATIRALHGPRSQWDDINPAPPNEKD